jgi:Protein of unknown function (DUF1592)/Protein of unknown function (DUF1588)/Protein of unknown function (DUF1585)/Protein of unknown function (DUF1587)/Protein of unknown function (DUF1595)
MTTKRLTWVGWVLTAGCAVACASQPAGRREDTSGGGDTGTIPDDGTRGTPLIAKGQADTEAGRCDAPTAGTPPLRRLSRIEYNNAVAALFGDATLPANDFVPEAKVAGFNSNVGIPVTDHNVTQYVAAAETIAKNVLGTLKTVTGCTASSDTACLDGWLTKTARKAFHGTLPAEEKTQLLTDYHAAAKDLDADSGISLAIEAILVSPRFLYVVELGQDGTGIVPLTASEMAGRLALSLWRSVPDDALLTAADSGALDDADGIAAQAQRMLTDPTKQAGSMLNDFVTQWMEIPSVEGLAKDGMKFESYTTQVRTSAIAETTETFRAVFGDAKAGVDQLFTLSYTMINGDVAPIYGLPATGAGFTKVNLPAGRRGILTQSSVLAAHAHTVQISPTLRGKLVRTKVLCDVVADPPPNVMRMLADPMGVQTERDVLDAHLKDASCAGCHQYMDPLGHAFSHFNAIGADIGDAGGPNAGEIVEPTLASVQDIAGKFAGPIELANMLAESEQVKQCFTIQTLRYVLGREEVTGDACGASQAWEHFAAGNYSLKEAIIGVVASDTFRYRTSISAGGACQ